MDLTHQPQAVVSVAQNKEKMRKIRKSKRYRTEMKRVKALKPKCEMPNCTNDTYTIHHDELTNYQTEEEYIATIKDGTAICFPCHSMGHKEGMVRCECGKGFHTIGKDYCRYCEPEDIKRERIQRQKTWDKIMKDKRHEDYLRAKEWKKNNTKPKES